MTLQPATVSIENYTEALQRYLNTRTESELYHASLLGQQSVEDGIGPDEIVGLHTESLMRVLESISPRQAATAATDALSFLLEVMIAFGVHHQKYLELRLFERTRDVEARALLEHQRAMDAEAQVQERTNVLALISHELRTPITAALGYLEMAERKLPVHPDQAEPLLGRAREALRRLSRLTADLVAASRNEPPQFDLSPINLREVVEQACGWATMSAEEKDINLVLLPSGPVLVLGNANALLGVIGNLLSNAVRYTPVGGQVEVSVTTNDRTAYVEVRDTGIGMTEDVCARVFERFFRAPEAKRTDGQGLGLGLTLVQQLTAAHNGRVEVSSVYGQGSTFRVLLPLAEIGDVSSE